MTRDYLDIAIDLTARRITLGRQIETGQPPFHVRGKGFEFLCLLMSQNGVDFCSRDEVHRLPRWRDMALESVGKQVARLIDGFTDAGHRLVDWERKTDGWRIVQTDALGIDPQTKQMAVAFIASTDWARGTRFYDTSAVSVAGWMGQNVKALLGMTSGNAAAAYTELKAAYSLTSVPSLKSISDILATRIGQRMPLPHMPVPSEDQGQVSMFELAAETRRLAAYALRADAKDWPTFANELKARLPAVIKSGDTTSQAIVLNGMALLANRQGQVLEALECIKEAAPLAVFSGDLILIQNVIFNFGNILYEAKQRDNSICTDEDFFALLELDIEIRSRFNIGMDSAQAELLTAFLHFERGNDAQAQAFLDAGKAVIGISNQRQDLALYHRTCGQLLLRQGHRQEGLEALDVAIAIYREMGNEPAVTQTLSVRAQYSDYLG